VLTVHHKSYYDAGGRVAQGRPEPWPNDYDDPNPVAFMTVHPRARFLVAVSGGGEETALAAHILKQAIEEWGVGGKTSLGYGRGTLSVRRRSGA
jgi:CRISPR-associated protein Cmr6